MKSKSDYYLSGNLVNLRPVRASVAPAAYHLLRDENVLEWLLWDGPSSESEIESTYRIWEDSFGLRDYWFAMEKTGETGLIGCIDIRFPQHRQQADIGYWLGRPFWNHGYMTDALRLVCDFCFNHLEVVRIIAPVFKGNIRSRRALEKNGFHLDGTLRSHLLKGDTWRDVWFMSMVEKDWARNRKTRSRLSLPDIEC